MRSTAAIPIHTPLSRRLLVFTLAFAFVLGFSLVFVIGWGGAATLLAQIFGEYKSILGKIGGVILILFGLSTLGIVKIPWLYYDTRPQWYGQSKCGLLASGLIGVFFAAGSGGTCMRRKSPASHALSGNRNEPEQFLER